MRDEIPPYDPRPFLLKCFSAGAFVLLGLGAIAASQLRPMPRRVLPPPAPVEVVVVPVPTAVAVAPVEAAAASPPKRPHREPRLPTQRPVARPDCLHSNDPGCGLDF